MHSKPHWPPVQVALPLAGAPQGTQELPQELGEAFETHSPAHRWELASQVTPHCVPSQVACWFVPAGQGVQLVPQLVIELSGTQMPLHLW